MGVAGSMEIGVSILYNKEAEGKYTDQGLIWKDREEEMKR
jgi:hypothetical protein